GLDEVLEDQVELARAGGGTLHLKGHTAPSLPRSLLPSAVFPPHHRERSLTGVPPAAPGARPVRPPSAPFLPAAGPARAARRHSGSKSGHLPQALEQRLLAAPKWKLKLSPTWRGPPNLETVILLSSITVNSAAPRALPPGENQTVSPRQNN